METTCNAVAELLHCALTPKTLESLMRELDLFTLHAVDNQELRALADKLLDESIPQTFR